MDNSPRLYNSRIIKLYTTYLGIHYPKVDVPAILKESRISKVEIDDPGHWFTQEEVDGFHQKVLHATGNPAISREVGRFSIASDVTDTVKKHALGLLSISSIYLLIAKLYPMFSRSVSLSARKLAVNRVEITVRQVAGVKEKSYQCENRLGYFESLATLFTDKFATITHEYCFHDGKDCCRYEVSWEEPPHIRWRRYLVRSVWGAVVLSPVAAYAVPMVLWPHLAAAVAIILMAIHLRIGRLERQDLIRTIQQQGNVAEEHIKEIDFRYRGLLLVQKIGQATSQLLDLNQLTQVVMDNIQNHLDFDRGIIMLADPTGRRMVFSAGYGLDNEERVILEKVNFRLDNPEAKGVFIQVFREQRPVLVEDIKALHDGFSERSRTLLEQIGSTSLICLPIVYENQSLGILAVDNVTGQRPLTQSDMNLLMGVAYQTAVSIFSVMANKKLQESEERYRSLYDNAPVAYFSINPDNAIIVNCNDAASRLLDHCRSRLIGSSWLDYFSGDQNSSARGIWVIEALQRGESIHNEEMRLVCQDNSEVWVNLSMEPFLDDQGKLLEGRCVLIDISESKKLEEKLRKSQRLEAMGTLAGGVAHDLSNILSAIVSYPDLLLMDIDPGSNLFEPLNKIKAAGMRATAIVHDLLTLARLGLQFTEVIDLNLVVGEFLRSPEFENLMGRHTDLCVRKELDAQLNAVHGSGVHLTKTLMNVVFNAAEAMPSGGEIVISTRNHAYPPAGTKTTGKEKPYVELVVRDNGTGIAKEDIERIFEPFFTKKVMGRSGTGLGMAIVWATVQEHKGHIEIDSEVGKGTSVRLFFPASQEAHVQPTPAPEIVDIMGQGESVLIVDDEAEQREIAAQMLGRLGYNVSMADCAQAALESVSQAPPDLLVLDMVMGTDVDGLAIYRRILSIVPDQKALIISGYSESDRVKEALDLGAGAFLSKPFGMKEIAAAVRKCLEEKTAQETISG